MSQLPRLETHQLQLRTEQRVLLDHCDWSVFPGECWCILGQNGAGKSTLLRSLAGLREVEGGRILLQQRELPTWRLDELARQRAFLPQHRLDVFSCRAIDVVLSARHPYHESHYWDSDADVEIAMRALAMLDVATLAQRDVRSLSGGERQRVAIAALMAQDTSLLLLDEPTSALDLAHQVSCMRLLASLCVEKNKSVIMVSHDLNLSYRIATHVLLMMPDASYLSGRKEEVMTENNLSACLGHPITRLAHDDQRIFLPQ